MAERDEILEFTKKDAQENGYYVCPDEELLSDLLDGLAKNKARYGYMSCPCRIASGMEIYDTDITCPCEYRDADVQEFGMCYCGLYVSKDVKENPKKMGPIPERRPVEAQDAALEAKDRMEKPEKTKVEETPPVSQELPPQEPPKAVEKKISVWRCKVCGYLAAREHPPSICPICKAPAERFERFSFG